MIRILPLLLLLSGCVGPLEYVRRNPAAPPADVPAAPVRTYEPAPGDCPAFQWDPANGAYKGVGWEDGIRLSTIPIGVDHPAAPGGVSSCLHLVIPPGAWVAAREARDRLPVVEAKRARWQEWGEEEVELSQREIDTLAAGWQEERRLRRRDTAVAGAVGAGAGGAAGVLLTILAVLLGR